MIHEMKSADPLFLLDVIKKIIENCLDFRKKIMNISQNKDLEWVEKEIKEAQNPKDFLLIITQMEFLIKKHQKVIFSYKQFFLNIFQRKKLKWNLY